jgi:hypothetical protein
MRRARKQIRRCVEKPEGIEEMREAYRALRRRAMVATKDLPCALTPKAFDEAVKRLIERRKVSPTPNEFVRAAKTLTELLES